MKRWIWVLLLVAGAAAAQGYPSHPLRMMVPYAAGLMAQAGTPPEVVAQLHRETAQRLRSFSR